MTVLLPTWVGVAYLVLLVASLIALFVCLVMMDNWKNPLGDENLKKKRKSNRFKRWLLSKSWYLCICQKWWGMIENVLTKALERLEKFESRMEKERGSKND